MLRDEMNARRAPGLIADARAAPAPACEGRYGTGHVRIADVTIVGADGAPRRVFQLGDEVTVRVAFRAPIAVDSPRLSFPVRDATGLDLLGTTTFEEGVVLPALGEGETGEVRLAFVNRFHAGSYGVSVVVNCMSRDLTDNVLFDQIDAATAFEVPADPAQPVHYQYDEPVSVLHG